MPGGGEDARPADVEVLRLPCTRQSASTTPCPALAAIRVVPMWCLPPTSSSATPGKRGGSARSQSPTCARPISSSAMCLPKAVTAVRMVWTSISESRQSSATRRSPKASRSSDEPHPAVRVRQRLLRHPDHAGLPGRLRQHQPVGQRPVDEGIAHQPLEEDVELLGRHVLARRARAARRARSSAARGAARSSGRRCSAHEELGRRVELPLAHQHPAARIRRSGSAGGRRSSARPSRRGCRSPRAPGW